ncbi:hypothetical protein DSUL_40023 [Desulfovibrionales bacterium]
MSKAASEILQLSIETKIEPISADSKNAIDDDVSLHNKLTESSLALVDHVLHSDGYCHI